MFIYRGIDVNKVRVHTLFSVRFIINRTALPLHHLSDSYTDSDSDDMQNRPSIDFGDLEDEEEEEEAF